MGMSMGMMDPGMMGMMGPGSDLNMFEMPPGDLVTNHLQDIIHRLLRWQQTVQNYWRDVQVCCSIWIRRRKTCYSEALYACQPAPCCRIN